MPRCLVPVLLLLPALASGQSVVVPAAYANAEARSLGEVPGFTGRFRMQVVVDGSTLSSLAGRSLDGIWLRRDRQFDRAYPASWAQLRVGVSHARTTPSTASPAFIANHAAVPSIVFDGNLTLPSSLPTPPPYPWQSPFAVRIPFTPTFAYAGGPLCLEFEGEVGAPQGTLWPVDFFQELSAATAATKLGCRLLAEQLGRPDTSAAALSQEALSLRASGAAASLPGQRRRLESVVEARRFEAPEAHWQHGAESRRAVW